jgi:DnaJ-class molecular chaperone
MKKIKCEECEGTGTIKVRERTSDYPVTYTFVTKQCNICHGTGKVEDDTDFSNAFSETGEVPGIDELPLIY